MKKYFLLTIIALTFALCFVEILYLDVDAVSVGEYEVGVKLGDWIEYELKWSNPPPPPYPVWVRREILGVNGTIITVNITQQLSNGTFTSEIKEGNVALGTGASAMIFIPANLKPGDWVNIEGFGSVEINDETRGEYLGIERTVVWADFESKGFAILIFWDKQKGVALTIHSYNAGTGVLGLTEAVKADIWDSGSSDDNSLDFRILMLIIIIVSLGAFIIYKRYVRSKRKKYR